MGIKMTWWIWVLILAPVVLIFIANTRYSMKVKKKWNKGYCAKCGGEWKMIDQYDDGISGGATFQCGCSTFEVVGGHPCFKDK